MSDLSPPGGFRGRFFTDLRARAAYSEGAGPFRIVPRAVAVPADRTDVALLLRFAADAGVPVTPRGAGSGMPGGNVGPGVVLDLRALDRPCRVSLQRTANVGCAVLWATLDEIAAHFRFRLPVDPSSGAFCTLGGMVATNAAGARSLIAGSIRRWVRGVELVTADGEAGWLARHNAIRAQRAPAPRQLVERLAAEERFQPVGEAIRDAADVIARRFPRTTKNSCGYALDHHLASGELIDLVIGSEGTLGVVTRVELALAHRPGAAATLLVGLADLDALAELVPRLLADRPVAVELLDRSFLDFAGTAVPFDLDGSETVLLIEIEDRDAEAARTRLGLLEETVAHHAVVVHRGFSPAEREQLWAIRHAASPVLANLPDTRRSLQVIEDGCVPVSALGRYLRGVRNAARRAGIEILAFGHAGDGHVHVNALVDPGDPTFHERLADLYDEVTLLVIELGGTPSGEHGDGRLRSGAVERLYGPELVALFRQVKHAFDPAGVLNPGVILGPGAGLRQLKVGPDAARIPDDVAGVLRNVERGAEWDRPPLTHMEEQP